jgi:fructokinase
VSAPFAGVELGGTKCVCTLARSHEEILDQRVIPTAAPVETLGAIAAVLREWDYRALGIASFGPIDLDRTSPTYGQIRNSPKRGWDGIDVVSPLAAIGATPVALDTDVNGAALAELRWGAGRGLKDLAYVTVGTGIGVGLIVDGQPVHGSGHPELGHLRIVRREGDDWPGICPYHADCVEGLASGPAIKARIGTGLEQADPDDPVWESVAWALAQLCQALVYATAPRVILIGGGVAQAQPQLLGRTEQMLVESLGGYVNLPQNGAYVRPPGLGAMAGPLGAIALAMDAAEAA